VIPTNGKIKGIQTLVLAFQLTTPIGGFFNPKLDALFPIAHMKPTINIW
jgi:hypothetical protein